MEIFLQNYNYINFFSGWAYLLFALACFLSWKSKLGRLAYFWMSLFGLCFALLKFLEAFFSGFSQSTNYIVVYSALLFMAMCAFFICAKDTYGKFGSNKIIKYMILPCSLIPFAGLFFGASAFRSLVFLFMWIPSSIITVYAIYKISKTSVYESKSIFIICVLFILYAFTYDAIEIIKMLNLHPFVAHIILQFIISIIVFLIGSLVFKYFKIAHERLVRIYDYMPLYWRHIPIGTILFIILIAGMFFSVYLENKSKNAIARGSETVVSSIAETISSRFSKSDQLSCALSQSPYVKEAMSYPSRASKTVIDSMFESFAKNFNVSIFTLNGKGEIVFHSDFIDGKDRKEIKLENKTYFSEALIKGRSKFFTKGFFDTKDGYFSSNAIYHVKHGTAGVLVIKDDVKEIIDRLKQYNNIYIVDKNGIVFLSDKDSGGYFKSLWSIYENHDGDRKDMLAKEVRNKDIVNINDELFYVTREFINEEGWSIVYFSSLAPIQQVKILSILGVSSIIIIIVLLFWSVNQSNRIFALALQHKAILSSARSIAIIATDIQGEIIVYGQGAEDITGYTRAEIIKENFENIFFDKYDRPIMFKDAIMSSVNPNNEWKCRKKDGTFVTLLMNIVPQFSVGHRLIGYIFSGADISATKKVENELEQQIKFLQTLIDSMPIAVFYKDSLMHIIGCNRAFENIMELSKNEMIGKTSEAIYFDKSAADISIETDKQILEDLSSISYERIVKFRKSAPRNLMFYKSAYKRLNGKFDGIIGVMIDVTADRKTQAERDVLQANLIQQNKLASLGELAGSIAHELNNPLSIILGYAQVLMKDKTLDVDSRKGVVNIYDAAGRSKSIITNMLEFARSDSSKKQNVNINDIIESTLLIVEKDFFESNIKIEKKLTAEIKPVSANPMQIQQVLLNMILNAKDAMPAGGKVTIETSIADEVFILNISDTGMGISKQDIPKIFEPFFTTKDMGKGTGLGLSICYGIINAHNAKISVDSVVGEGTSFIIKFPLSVKNSIK